MDPTELTSRITFEIATVKAMKTSDYDCYQSVSKNGRCVAERTIKPTR